MFAMVSYCHRWDRIWLACVWLLGLLLSCSSQEDPDIVDLDRVELEVEVKIEADSDTHRNVWVATLEELFVMEELKLLIDEQFYPTDSGDHEQTLVIQLHTAGDTSSLKQRHILKARPQSVFGRVLSDQFEYIAEDVAWDTTIDALRVQLQSNAETNHPLSLMIVDHSNGRCTSS